MDSAALPETNAPAVPVRPTPVPVLVSAGSAPNPAPVVPAPAVVPSAANPALIPDGSAHVSTGPSMVEARPEASSAETRIVFHELVCAVLTCGAVHWRHASSIFVRVLQAFCAPVWGYGFSVACVGLLRGAMSKKA